MARGQSNLNNTLTVRNIMRLKPVTVTAETSTLEAIDVMRRNKVGCLPVVDGDRLVGIITAYDFLRFRPGLSRSISKAVNGRVSTEAPSER